MNRTNQYSKYHNPPRYLLDGRVCHPTKKEHLNGAEKTEGGKIITTEEKVKLDEQKAKLDEENSKQEFEESIKEIKKELHKSFGKHKRGKNRIIQGGTVRVL